MANNHEIGIRITADGRIMVEQFDEATGTIRRFASESTKAGKSAADGIKRPGVEAKRTNEELARLRNMVLGLISIGAAFRAAMKVGNIADEYASVNARIRIATDSQREYARAQREVFESAQATGSVLATTAELYARLDKSLGQIAHAQEIALRVTDLVNKGFVSSGTSAAEASGAVRQFLQGIQSGVLRGDEFNSVMEQAPVIADALTASLGKSRGELRELAEQGELTAQVVLEGLLKSADLIEAEYAQMPLTIGRAWQQLSNEWARYIGQADAASGASASVAASIQGVAEHIPELVRLTTLLTKVTLTYFVTFRAARGIPVAFQAISAGIDDATSRLRTMQKAGLVMMAAFVGFEIGSWLRDQFVEARVAGARLVGLMLEGWERIKFGAQSLGVVVRGMFDDMLNWIRQRMADILDTVAGGLAKVPKMGGLSEDLSGMAAGLRAIEAGAGSTEEKLEALAAEYARNSIQIKATIKEMIDYEFQQDSTAESTANTKTELEKLLEALSKLPGASSDAEEKARELAEAQDLIQASTLAAIRVIDQEAAVRLEYGLLLDELASKLEAEGVNQALVGEAIKLVTAARDKDLAAIRRQVGPYDQFLADLETEIELLQLSAREREIELGVRAAIAAAQEQGIALTEAELAQLRERLALVDDLRTGGGLQAGLGIAGNLVQDLASGTDALTAFARAAGNAGDAIREFGASDNEGLQNLGALLSSFSAGTAAGQAAGGGASGALAGAFTGALTGYQYGGVYGAIAGAIIGAFGGYGGGGAERPEILYRPGQQFPGSRYNFDSALGGFSFERREGFEGTELRDLGEQIRAFDNALAQVLGSDLTEAAAAAVAALENVALRGGDIDPRVMMQERFDAVLSVVSPVLASVIRELGGSLEEQVENLAAGLDIERAVRTRTDVFQGRFESDRVLEALFEVTAAGSTLADTWERVTASTQGYLVLLDLFDQQWGSNLTRMLRLTDDIAEALGGAERAQQLYNQVINEFFDPAEVAGIQLTNAGARRNAALGALGLDPNIGNAEFRSLLEEAMGSGDSTRIAGFLEAGAAIAEVNELRDALLEMIYAAQDAVREAEAESRQFRIGMAERLRDVGGDGSVAGIIQSELPDLRAAVGAADDVERAIDHLDDFIQAVDDWLRAARDEVLDWAEEARGLIEAQLAELDAEQSAIMAAAQQRASAAQASMQAMIEAQRDAIEEQRQALREQIALARDWLGVLETAESMIQSLTLSNANPVPTSARASLLEAQIAQARAAFEGAEGAERAAAAAQLLQLLEQRMSIAQELFQRPSGEYLAIYNQTLAELNGIREEAAAESATLADLEAALQALQGSNVVSINRQTDVMAHLSQEERARLAEIEATRAELQEELLSIEAEAQERLASIDAEARIHYEWARNTGEELRKERHNELLDALNRITGGLAPDAVIADRLGRSNDLLEVIANNTDPSNKPPPVFFPPGPHPGAGPPSGGGGNDDGGPGRPIFIIPRNQTQAQLAKDVEKVIKANPSQFRRIINDHT